MKTNTSNVVTIKPDSKLADDTHANARQTLLGQLNTADDLLGNALVFALRMTAEHGKTSADEVAKYYPRCASPAQYSSMFNLGAKVQGIIGEAATLALIDKAASGKGSGFNRAKAALASVVRTAKDSGVKTLGKAAAKLASAGAIKAADASVEKAAAKREAAKATPPAPRAPKPAETQAKVVEAALQCGATHRSIASALKVISQQARKLSAPEGRDAAHTEALTALATACETWQVFAK